MACDATNIYDYLAEFSGKDPLEAVICPFAGSTGADMGMTVFSLWLFSMMGLGLTVRVQHPAPVLVASTLSAGLLAATIPGIAAKILALVIFFGIGGIGLVIYQRAQSSL